jgi:hypothetical protein
VPIRSRRAPPIDGRETIILRLEPIESAMDREMSTTYPFPPPQERSVTGSGDPIFPCVSFNLDVPTGAPIYKKALVKCLPGVRSGGRLAKPHPPATGSPLPAGQRRAQLNHLTRRCDFPRLAQDAHPDGRIGLSGRMACTAEGARGGSPGDETGPGEDFE